MQKNHYLCSGFNKLRNSMKRFWLFMTVAALLTACSQTNGVDPRDELVGNYTYTADGNLDFVVVTETMSFPIKGTGTFSITKSGSKNKVLIHVFNDSAYATLSGNQLRLDEDTYSMEMQDMTAEISVSNDVIKVNGTHLTWDTDLRAVARSGGMGIVGNGSLSMSGDKSNP